MDPLVEKYLSYSIYNYCANNPISFIDPKGDTIKPRCHLANSILSMKAFNLWAHSSEERKFYNLFGEGKKFGNVLVIFDIDSEEVGYSSKGDTKMYAVYKKGKERLLMNVGDKLKKGEKLKFIINYHPVEDFYVKEGDIGYNKQLKSFSHSKKQLFSLIIVQY